MELSHDTQVAAVNVTGRFGLAAGGHDLSVFMPDTGDLITHRLAHPVERFSHAGVVTAAFGEGGATLLLGGQILDQRLGFGPYALIGETFGARMLPDVGGLPLAQTAQGYTLAGEPLPAHLGPPVTAGIYRGRVLTLFAQGPVLSLWASREAQRSYIQATTFSDVYIHPHLRFVASATPRGLAYSVDDAQSWQMHEMGGWPLRFGPGESWVVRGRALERFG